MGEWYNGIWNWNLRWRRDLFDWEYEDVNRLMSQIDVNKPRLGVEDSVGWNGSNDTNFPISHIVNKLFDSSVQVLPKGIINYVSRSLVPPRAKLTIWLASLEKLKTGDLLVEKGIIDQQDAQCPFCKLVVESNSHILFTCSFSWSTWMEILNGWGINGVLHDNCSLFITEWFGVMRNRRWKKLWTMTLGCVIWSLWYQRNKVKFEECDPDFQKFIYSLKVRLRVWAKELLGTSDCSQMGLLHL